MQRSDSSSGSDNWALAFAATLISLCGFLYYFGHGEILLYGDAVAHINIARRVFDSRTPGPLQLGTVWLPLPHIATIPFILFDWPWRTGAGGSVVSLVSYVLGALGGARFFWGDALAALAGEKARKLAGWIAAFAFLLNPNLIYMQTTAMTEVPSLALSIWAIIFYAEFASAHRDARSSGDADPRNQASAQQSLLHCAIVLAAGMLTRYDQWFLAFAILICVAIQVSRGSPEVARLERKAFAKSIVLVGLIAVLWFAYNFGQYGNALEFANGPYSARAIAERSAVAGQPPHPGHHDVRVAAIYFFKSAELNLAAGKAAYLWVTLALVGAFVLLRARRVDLAALLWLPIVFYSLSIAYGGVPIFMPVWWPFSYYNVRYGLELLPAFAISAGLALLLLSQFKRSRGLTLGVCIALLATYIQVQRTTPISLREAQVNSGTRIGFERQLAAVLKLLPHDATLLVYTGNHVGALQIAGIPLKHTINENNYKLWQAALAHPAQEADYVVAMQGDPVWQATHDRAEGLTAVAVIHAQGQPAAEVYQSNLSAKAH